MAWLQLRPPGEAATRHVREATVWIDLMSPCNINPSASSTFFFIQCLWSTHFITVKISLVRNPNTYIKLSLGLDKTRPAIKWLQPARVRRPAPLRPLRQSPPAPTSNSNPILLYINFTALATCFNFYQSGKSIISTINVHSTESGLSDTRSRISRHRLISVIFSMRFSSPQFRLRIIGCNDNTPCRTWGKKSLR